MWALERSFLDTLCFALSFHLSFSARSLCIFKDISFWVVAFCRRICFIWTAFVQLEILLFLFSHTIRPSAPCYGVGTRFFFAYEFCKRTPAGQSRTKCFLSRAIEVATLTVRLRPSGTNLHMFHFTLPITSRASLSDLESKSARTQRRKAICASARLTSATSRGEADEASILVCVRTNSILTSTFSAPLAHYLYSAKPRGTAENTLLARHTAVWRRRATRPRTSAAEDAGNCLPHHHPGRSTAALAPSDKNTKGAMADRGPLGYASPKGVTMAWSLQD